MAKVCIVTRHLHGLRPVPSAVFEEPDHTGGYDDLDHYFKSAGETHIRRFKEKFPEFEDADWHVDIIELTEHF